MKKVAQISCGTSHFRDSQKSSGHRPGQLLQPGSASDGRVGQDDLQRSLPTTISLEFCESTSICYVDIYVYINESLYLQHSLNYLLLYTMIYVHNILYCI